MAPRWASRFAPLLLLASLLGAGCARFGYERLEPLLDDGVSLDGGTLTCDAPGIDAGCASDACGLCVNGQGCTSGGECASGSCVDGECRAPTCDDGLQNGSESGRDCGGDTCAPCAVGETCGQAQDCASGACASSRCVGPLCVDGLQNQDEAGIDCGGSLCSACPSCADGLQNQDETAVDCGGGLCGPCATCGDGVRNQDETAIDCGGLTCPACALGSGCVTGNDCASGACAGSVCQAPSGQCVDTAECTCASFGGNDYQLCTTELVTDDAMAHCQSLGMQLVRIDDAAENDWLATTATAAGLFSRVGDSALIGASDREVPEQWVWPDGEVFWSGTSNGAPVNGLYENWTNQHPTGGITNCSALLASGLWIAMGCASALPFICQTSLCAGCPTCGDGVQNQDETDVDCGGALCSPCPNDSSCNTATDCASSVCTQNVCVPSGGCTPSAGCGCDSFGGANYLLCTNEVTRDAADAACASAGMSLLKVSGSAENDWLRQTFANRGMFVLGTQPMVWLGGTDAAVEGDWLWPDAELFWDGNPIGGVYQNWAPMEPRGQSDCMGMIDDGTWKPRACNSLDVVYACESP